MNPLPKLLPVVSLLKTPGIFDPLQLLVSHVKWSNIVEEHKTVFRLAPLIVIGTRLQDRMLPLERLRRIKRARVKQ